MRVVGMLGKKKKVTPRIESPAVDAGQFFCRLRTLRMGYDVTQPRRRRGRLPLAAELFSTRVAEDRQSGPCYRRHGALTRADHGKLTWPGFSSLTFSHISI